MGVGATVGIGGGIGILLLALIITLLGGDPSVLLQQIAPPNEPMIVQQSQRPPSAQENRQADFVSVVLAETEDTWTKVFGEMGRRYQKPKIVLYSGAVDSACGFAQAAMGPFYCPLDQKVYIDLSFYRDLQSRYHAPGDFAQAYVIAHEIGHHVQKQLGITDQVQALQQRSSRSGANQLSVRLELQADCLAGVWAHNAHKARQILEEGDIEEALNAASQIGDDRMQRRSAGYVVPDSFTHGSSAQRTRWFTQGIKTGDIEQCNTFEARSL
jgi:predicted metalloprotease